MSRKIGLAVLVCGLLHVVAMPAAADTAFAPIPKPRVVVMTDIGGDPDDEQSLVRFLLYTCDLDVEGLCTGFGHGHDRRTRPDLLRRGVEAYAKVWPNLRKHRADYPTPDKLLAMIKDGSNGDPHKVGPGLDSEASEWILKVLQRDDPRPVWFTIWGGPRELAQAIWKAQQTLSPKALTALKKKIRVHSIADQDRTAGWVKANHPDVFWIYSNQLFRGIWKSGDQSLVSPEWLEKNVRTGHGALGPIYPAKAAGKAGVKEGDTPSFLWILPTGLGDPEKPEQGNWGGRFRPSGHGREYVPAPDRSAGKGDLLYTIHRWRRAYQNDFEARMDWCVKPAGEANHPPRVVCNGDASVRVLLLRADPGAKVALDAAGARDPDGDGLAYRWWVYRDAGDYQGRATIEGASKSRAELAVPPDASGRRIHVILEVTDTGKPPLTRYRRVVVRVTGEPVAPPGEKPVTRLGPPPAKTGPWTFYRGVNLNGPPVEIDGHKWDGGEAGKIATSDRAFDSPEVALRPPTDPARAKMIHSSRWNRAARISLTGLAEGTYAVYVYVWEDNNAETFSVSLQGRVVEKDYYSGSAGQWWRLGPWVAKADGGSLVVTSRGGAANFSGIEVWRKGGARK